MSKRMHRQSITEEFIEAAQDLAENASELENVSAIRLRSELVKVDAILVCAIEALDKERAKERRLQEG